MSPKATVAVTQMTMNRLDFGELVFGGNPKLNLKKEANMNRSVVREKLKATSKGPTFFGSSATVH